MSHGIASSSIIVNGDVESSAAEESNAGSVSQPATLSTLSNTLPAQAPSIPMSYPLPKRIVKVPRNGAENRELKQGHVESNNEHIAYLNFPLFWPSLFFTILSLTCFAGAVYASLEMDFIPNALQLQRGFIARYGSSRFRCNSTIPFPNDGLPSLLHLFELNVIGNVLFRYTSVIPLALRIFHAHTIRGIVQQKYIGESTNVFKICNDLMPILTGVEALAMALFSIVTVHNDFAEFNRYCKIVFAMAASLNMLVTSLVLFAFHRKGNKCIDTLSVCVKLISTAIFCYFAPQYFQFHLSSISYPTCHSYLPSTFAMIEYTMTAAYGAFHFTQLIDIRDIYFVCYPRTCSGECEPLQPQNFRVGAKYEHCRAFEYNQRRKWEENGHSINQH